MGTVMAIIKGTKEPSSVYNPGPDGNIGLPTSYTRCYYFDYYKKGINPPKYGND
jgi:hypothetical protein